MAHAGGGAGMGVAAILALLAVGPMPACGSSDSGTGGANSSGGGTAGTGAAGTGAVDGGGGSAGACTDYSGCIDCLDTNCTVAYTQCEFDAQCGPERLKYAKCLSACNDPADCSAALVANGGPKAAALSDCAKGSCASAPGACIKP